MSLQAAAASSMLAVHSGDSSEQADQDRRHTDCRDNASTPRRPGYPQNSLFSLLRSSLHARQERWNKRAKLRVFNSSVAVLLFFLHVMGRRLPGLRGLLSLHLCSSTFEKNLNNRILR